MIKEKTMEEARVIASRYDKGTLGSFSMALMDLFGKADETNKIKLGIGFPEYRVAHHLWFIGDYDKDINNV